MNPIGSGGKPELPFVGRTGCVARVLDLLESAAATGVVVSGWPGLGKSRLLAEICAAAAKRGHRVISAAGTESASTLPMAAFGHLLPAPAEQADDRFDVIRAAANRLVPQQAERPGQAERRGRTDRRAVVAVDDAHVIDAASATLVHLLALSKRAFVVVASRRGERLPDAVDRLWRGGSMERLDLAPLAAADVGELLRLVLGGPVGGTTAMTFARLSGGNPLLLRELLTAASTQRLLSCIGGVWELTAAPSPSPALEEMVRLRLGSLDPSVRDVIELIGHVGRLELALARQVVSEAALEAAEAEGLVRLVADGHRAYVTLDHPLYGEMVRLGPTRLRPLALRRRLAAALAATGPTTCCGARWSVPPRPGPGCAPRRCSGAVRTPGRHGR